MPRKRIDIPADDIKYHLKGLKTLINEKMTQEEIAEYYRQHGIQVDQSTISRNVKKLKEE
jgi:arginine repressor